MNERLVNKTRDEIADSADELTDKKARTLFESAFPTLVDDLTQDARLALFQAAKAESEVLRKGHISWNAAFNSYVSLMRLTETIRAEDGEYTESVYSDLALEVLNSANRMTTLFYIVRKHKDMSEEVGRSVLEAAFPVALNGVSEEAKRAIFTHAYERASSLGWGQVIEEYTNVMDIISQLKVQRVNESPVAEA